MRKRRATLLVDAGIWLRLAGDDEGARKLFEQALALDPDNRQAAQLVVATSAAAVVEPPRSARAQAPAAQPNLVARARRPPVRGPAKPAPPVRAESSRAPDEAPAPTPTPGDERLATPEDEFRGFDSAEVLDKQVAEHATIPWMPAVDLELVTRRGPAVAQGPQKPLRPGVPPPRAPSPPASAPRPASSAPAEVGQPPPDSDPTFLHESALLPSPEAESPLPLSRQEAIVEYLRETDAYLRYGIYEKALEYAAKVLAEDPENDEAHAKAKTALLASKGSAAAFEQLIKVLRLYAARLDAERAEPFLDELMARQPGHPDLPVLLSVLRPYEVDLPSEADEGPILLDQTLVGYLEGTLSSGLSSDVLETLPPEVTVPSGLQLPAPFRMAKPEVEVSAGERQQGSPDTLPPGLRLRANLSSPGTDGPNGFARASPPGASGSEETIILLERFAPEDASGSSAKKADPKSISKAEPTSDSKSEPKSDSKAEPSNREARKEPEPDINGTVIFSQSSLKPPEEPQKTLFADDEADAEAPQPPFRRPKRRR